MRNDRFLFGLLQFRQFIHQINLGVSWEFNQLDEGKDFSQDILQRQSLVNLERGDFFG